MFNTIKPSKALTKKVISILLLTMTAVMFSLPAMSLESLRGDHALDADANKAGKHRVNSVEGGYERSFELQPPLIPHTVDKYKITLNNNGCMKCHSEKAYKKEKTKRIGDSHYVNRDGETLKTISSRRYFCNQCHVPQVRTDPLVENVYEGIN